MKLSSKRKFLKFYHAPSNAESAAKKRIYNKSLKFVRISTLKDRFYYLFDRKAVLFFTYILLRFWSALNELAPSFQIIENFLILRESNVKTA